MKHYKIILSFLLAFAIITCIASPVIAVSVVDNAEWYGLIRISNNDTGTASFVSTNMTLNVASLISNGYISSDCSDIAIQENGTDRPFMPGYGSNPWIIDVPSIDAGTNIDYSLYVGNVTGGFIRYFPDTTGMISTDNDSSLELHTEGSVVITGYIDTTAGLDKDLVNKSDAFRLSVNETNSQTIDLLVLADSTSQLNTTTDSTNSLSAGDHTRGGQYIPSFPIATITQVSFSLKKVGSPGGTANITVRKVADDSIIGIVGTQNIASLGTSSAWYDYTNSVNVTASGDVRVLCEYNNGTAGVDYIRQDMNTTHVVSGNNTEYNGGYVTYAGDCDFKIYYTPYLTTSAAGVNSGNHTVIAELTPSWLTLTVDSTSNQTASDSFDITDNSENWTWFQNDVMRYVESCNITVGGVTRQSISWQYSDVFYDASENGNTAYPTFRTESSNPFVSAALVSFVPTQQAAVTTFILSSISDIFTSNPDALAQAYTETPATGVEGLIAPINEILDAGEIPQALWWFPFILIGICLIGLLIYGATAMGISRGKITEPNQQGSLLTMCIVIEMLLILVGVINIIPLWPAELFPIAAIAIIVSRKHYSWG